MHGGDLMKEVIMTVQTKSKAGKQNDQRQRSDQTNLARRYGQIGIPALAAALRYATTANNPTRAPALNWFDERFRERLA